MFRSSTIIRELALNLAKVIFILKLTVKLRRYLLWNKKYYEHIFMFLVTVGTSRWVNIKHLAAQYSNCNKTYTNYVSFELRVYLKYRPKALLQMSREPA